MNNNIVKRVLAILSSSVLLSTQLLNEVTVRVWAINDDKQSQISDFNISLGGTISVKEDEILYGDANGDGNVDLDDAAFIEDYAAKRYTKSIADFNAADVDLDGAVTLRDAEILYMYDNMRSAGNKLDLPYKGEVNWQTYPDPAKYEIINESMDWYEAEDYCEEHGGHLVTITSQFEQAQVEALIQSQTNKKNNYWIGMKVNADDEFVWVTNEKSDYENWNPAYTPYYQYKVSSIAVKNKSDIKLQAGKWMPMVFNGERGHVYFGLNNFGFIMEKDGLDVSKYQLWKDENNLPPTDIYSKEYWKLDCDVKCERFEVDKREFLNLDLNGHKVDINSDIKVQSNGELIIRDSSSDKTGTINATYTKRLFSVDGKLSIYDGTFNGSSIEGAGFLGTGASATIGVNYNGVFDFYGGVINSNYNNVLSLDSSSGVVNLIGGNINTISECSQPSLDKESAIWLGEEYTGTLNITGTDIYADKGAGIYGNSAGGIINISGGSIRSEESYGLFCTGDTAVNISEKVSVNGKNGGIYIPKGKKLNIIGKINSFDSSLFVEASGTCTNGLSNYYSRSDIESYLPQIKSNGKASVDDNGELFLAVSETTTNTATTTTITSKTSTTTTKATTKTTSKTSTTTTTAKTTIKTNSQTSTVLSTTSVSTLTTGVICTLPVRKLNIEGKMEAKEMTLEEIKAARIPISDPENYHIFNYEIKLIFQSQVITINKSYIPDHLEYGTFYSAKINNVPYKIINFKSTETEEMYMIITGECKWLKEFYDVALIVINKDSETLENCSATIDVPEGLTLVNNDETQKLGDLEAGKAFEAHWYIRGDVAGDYELSSVFKGCYSGVEIPYNFKTENPLHVYAGNALKMKIISPKYSFFDEDYPVTIVFENVSDRPIYNLEHTIKDVSQVSKMTTRRYLDGKCTEEVNENQLQKQNINRTYKINKLEPGEKLVTEIVIHDIWRSILEKQIGDMKILTDIINLLTCMSNNPLLKGCNFVSGLCRAYLEGMTVAHVLDFVEVTTLEGSTTKVPYTHEEVQISENLEKKYSATNPLNEVSKYLLGKEVKLASENCEHAYNAIINLDYANHVVPSDDEDKSKAQAEVEKSYYYSKGLLSLLPAGDLTTSITTLGHDVYYRFNQPEGKRIPTKFYVEEADGTRHYAPKSGVVKSSAVYDDFEIEIVDGKYSVGDNGEIILESDAIIKITPKKANIKATIGAVSEDGEEITSIPLQVVDEHECKGEYVMLVPPENGEGAYIASFCEICHDLIECRQISVDEVAMLSNGKTYSKISDAVADAENSDEELKLYIFGDVNIDEDVTIPEKLETIIIPDTKINLTDGCKFVANGEIDDYSSYNYNLSGNGPILTNDITTTVPDEATTLPAVSLWGDVNCDGDIDMSDVVLIMQSLANPNKYGLGGTAPNAITVQGQTNGDVDIASKGLTSNDALLIQEFLLHRVNTLEPSKS